MPFPYMYPVGALIAGVILGATLTLFALVLKLLDRAVTRVGDSILSGLVAGFGGWSGRPRATPAPSSPAVDDGLEPADAIPVQLVRRG
jgi:hypothetical protein